LEDFIALGKKIYNTENPREMHRLIVFVIRCLLNRGKMKELAQYFNHTALLQRVAAVYPFVYEQPTRAFFYNQSTFRERIDLLEQHMDFLQEKLSDETIQAIYCGEQLELWDGGEFEDKPLKLVLYFEPGYRKEGLLSVRLNLGQSPLYIIMFWIAKDKNGEWSMWIGAMQGPNMENSRDIIKRVTKYCHAYRTKNLIAYSAQAVARNLGLKHIFAVTNQGYYANNHVRRDRKLKTDFSAFWKELGGWDLADSRFNEIPLVEPRKTMEEVPTRKRANYRRRFAMLDELDDSVKAHMAKLKKSAED
jgi:uncharacterized protein VirK/YbjX